MFADAGKSIKFFTSQSEIHNTDFPEDRQGRTLVNDKYSQDISSIDYGDVLAKDQLKAGIQ